MAYCVLCCLSALAKDDGGRQGDRKGKPTKSSVAIAFLDEGKFAAFPGPVGDNRLGQLFQTPPPLALNLAMAMNPDYVPDNALWKYPSIFKLVKDTDGIDVIVRRVKKKNESFFVAMYESLNGEVIQRRLTARKPGLSSIKDEVLADLGFNSVVRQVEGSLLRVDFFGSERLEIGMNGLVSESHNIFLFRPISQRTIPRGLVTVTKVGKMGKAIVRVSLVNRKESTINPGDFLWIGPIPEQVDRSYKPIWSQRSLN